MVHKNIQYGSIPDSLYSNKNKPAGLLTLKNYLSLTAVKKIYIDKNKGV